MNRKAEDYFIFSVAVMLFVAAVAKIYSATGGAEALGNLDPLIPLSNRHLFYLAGGFELCFSAFLLIKPDGQKVKLIAIAWLGTNYLLYRLVLWWLGQPVYCDCLASFNENLPLSPRIIYPIMLAWLAWFMAGSCLLLVLDWLEQRKASRLNQRQADQITAGRL